MPTYVALLRGINVGGANRVKMELLRELFAGEGAKHVTTYIQSGNVVFDHPARGEGALVTRLAAAIARASGLAVPVVLRTASELASVIERNPFARRGDAAVDDAVHTWFLPAAPAGLTVAATGSGAETYAVVGREVYLWLPDGIGRSRLAATLSRTRSLAGATSRNWRTVTKLAALAAKLGA